MAKPETIGRGQAPPLRTESRRNLAFVERLGCYDHVVTYDRIRSLSPDMPVAFVDMAGDGGIVEPPA